MLKYYLLPLLLIIIAFNIGFLHAQNLIFKGKVVDKQTKMPIGYATIVSEDRKLITNSNEKGEFKITFAPNLRGKKMIISHIGLKPLSFNLASQVNDNVVIFTLEPNKILLDEIVITDVSVLTIFKKFLKNMSLNYPKNNQAYQLFYKYYLQFGNSLVEYETILNINKKILDKKKIKNIEIVYKNIIHNNKEQSENIPKKYISNNLSYFYSFSFHKFQCLKSINKGKLKESDFKFEGITTYMGYEVYKISYEIKKENINVRDVYYITTSTYALVKLESEIRNPELELLNYCGKKSADMHRNLYIDFIFYDNFWHISSIDYFDLIPFINGRLYFSIRLMKIYDSYIFQEKKNSLDSFDFIEDYPIVNSINSLDVFNKPFLKREFEWRNNYQWKNNSWIKINKE